MFCFLISGYMSPEYAMDGIFSVKSDIFSLGVIILEILSGKRNSNFGRVWHTGGKVAFFQFDFFRSKIGKKSDCVL